jgi:hypothetical protein
VNRFVLPLFTLNIVATSCSPTLPPPQTAARPEQATKTDQSNLLLFPVSDAESLLGRAVHVTGDGGWTIADERAPGCEVSVRKEPSQFHTSRQVDMHSMTSLSGGYAKFVDIEAKFGKQNTADIEIDNTEILHADTRGACGEMIVDTVFVGHGKRNIVAAAQESASANVNVGVVSASPAVDAASKQIDALEWKDDQAYGFTYTKSSKVEPLKIKADMPSFVTEGDYVHVSFSSEKPAYLVVYYISGGKGDVLWPSNEEQSPMVDKDHPADLPSKAEAAKNIQIIATLAQPGQPSRETLVVYGFANKGDFDAMKPGADGQSDDGPTFVADLTKRLEQIPMDRWSRAILGYTIQPCPTTPDPNNPCPAHKP